MTPMPPSLSNAQPPRKPEARSAEIGSSGADAFRFPRVCRSIRPITTVPFTPIPSTPIFHSLPPV